MKPQCIVCNSTSSKQIYFINNFQILKCLRCKFIFSYPKPTLIQLKKAYKKFSYLEGFANESLIRRDAKRILSSFHFLGLRPGRLLDLGSGAGFLLDEARNRKWDVEGVEIAHASLYHAEKVLGLTIHNTDINEFHSKNKYEAIVLSQVIEHMSEPTPTLQKIHKLLKNDGVACISTPNIESLLAKILKEDFNYLTPPNHVLFFSPQSLETYLKKHGFRILKLETYGYPEDIGIIYRKLKHNQIRSETQKEKNKKPNDTNRQLLKPKTTLKHYIFENFVRYASPPLLDIVKMGSMIEVYISKN